MNAKLKRIKVELRKRMHLPIRVVGAWSRRVVEGHFRYFAVPGNQRSLKYFQDHLARLWYTVIRRRSHKARLRRGRMKTIQERDLPKPTILHPWPSERFYASTRGRSPVQ